MIAAIHGKDPSKDSIEFIKSLIEILENNNIQLHISEAYYKSLKRYMSLSMVHRYHNRSPKEANFMLSIGGDGTLLEAVTHVADHGTPVLGINTGRLGFLAISAPQHMEEAIGKLLEGDFVLEERLMVAIECKNDLFGNVNFGLNEFTVLKQDTSSMIIVNAYLNGEFLNSYWADGLIVSTPTGSTGYSLSCGGPVVEPTAKSFIITPVSPHNLSTRPLIVDEKSVIELEVESRSKYFMVSLDSRSKIVRSHDPIKIRRSKYNAKLIRFNNFSFVKTLREKLNWGLDVRSFNNNIGSLEH